MRRKSIEGQINLFDIVPRNEKNSGLGEPCESCDVQWCSAICFIRRGYMWDRLHRFIKNADGKNLRKAVEDRECKEIKFDSTEVIP